MSDGQTQITGADVLVFQMGKVASKSVQHSLLASGVKAFHTHRQAQAASWLAERRAEGGSPMIITGFRDLLGRNISDFFFNISNPATKSWFVGDAAFVQTLTVDQLIAEFDARHRRNYRTAMRGWLMRFTEATGVDLFSELFPYAQGFHVLASTPSVAIYRVENLNATFEPMCRRLGLPDGPLIRRNDAASHGYADRYRAFIDAYRPDDDTVAMIYDSPLMRHFYSGAEIDRFIASWRKA